MIQRPLASIEEAEKVIADMSRQNIDGMLSPREVALNIPGFILEATLRQSIPSMFDGEHYAEDGGLASYGARTADISSQAAGIIDLIIRGRDPAEIPTERAAHLDFVINARVAGALGLQVSPVVLFQADRILPKGA